MLGRLTADDQDGYHRVRCPAAAGKIRCPLRPASMTLDRDRPEILQHPEHPQACCAQQTITVPPGVLAKTAQKHDYPSAPWRRSYARRTGAERGFATIKDPATSDITRGWCRLIVLTPLMLFATTLLIVRNQRILRAWDARQEDSQHRAAKGLPPKTRKRRRKTLADLAAGPPYPGAATTAAATRRKHAPTQDKPGTGPGHSAQGPAPGHQPGPNVRPKHENDPHRNVKTSGWVTDRDVNPEPAVIAQPPSRVILARRGRSTPTPAPRWPSSPGGQAWPRRPARSGHPSSSPGCPAADLINRSAVFSRRWQRSAGLPGQR
jgi:hypothetical protein